LDGVVTEIEVLRAVRHPRLCPYLACEIKTHVLYVCSGYAPGGSVADWLTDAGPLGEPAILRVRGAVLEGLVHLHRIRLVHGALRGGNVLLGPGAAIRLADFGLAGLRAKTRNSGNSVGAEGRDTGRVLGVARPVEALLAARHWLAPELLAGGPVLPASDIWAFGCLVVEMATGSPPATGVHERAQKRVAAGTAAANFTANAGPPLLPGELKQLHASLHALVQQCIRATPASRPTASELLLASKVETGAAAGA